MRKNKGLPVKTITEAELKKLQKNGAVRKKMGAQPKKPEPAEKEAKSDMSGPSSQKAQPALASPNLDFFSALESLCRSIVQMGGGMPLSAADKAEPEDAVETPQVEIVESPQIVYLEPAYEPAPKTKPLKSGRWAHSAMRGKDGLLSAIQTTDPDGKVWTHRVIRGDDKTVIRIDTKSGSDVSMTHSLVRNGKLITDLVTEIH